MGNLKGFKITKSSEILNALQNYKKTYHEKGMFLGFDKMKDNYSMQLGNCTDWTGYPMSGKTQFLMECLINTSLFYDWKHLIYFPDVGNNIEIIADLIHKKTGKSFNPDAPNSITDKEISIASEWVCHYFKVLTKSDVKAKMTAIEFWDFAVELKNTEGLHTASIDSWKDLSHDYSSYGGYAQYLEFVLPYRNQIAEDNDLHLHTIIHPKLTEKVNGKRVPPGPYDLKGGSEWFNSGKCMITVHREDLSDNQCEVYFNKIKPRSIGKIGMINLRFDIGKFRYYDLDTSNPNQHINIYANRKDHNQKNTVELKSFSESMNEHRENLPF